MDYVIKCSKHYYGLSITELRELAYQFAKKLNISFPENWEADEMAGLQWYYGFMLRHKTLTLRSPEQTSLNRVKAFCRENVDHFFRNLDAVRTAYAYSPSSIWNMDETGFSSVPTKMGKIISIKGLKRVGQVTSAERGSMITLAFAVSAIGNTIPPFYIFPQKKMSPMYLTHASNETVGYANGSGWMIQPDFFKWMNHFIKHTHSSKEHPTLLLMDNHSSHMSVDAIDLATEHGVTILTFPPHCSHKLQPLDVSVYGPVKGRYNALHNAWMKENVGRIIDITLIPKFVKEALMRGATAENITAGFRATGISPYDPGVFNENDFVCLGVDEANAEASAIEHEYNEEEQRRILIDETGSNLEVAAHAEISTSEPSVSSMSRTTTLSSVISSVGPLHASEPKKKSNRGRKPQNTTILTSPESIARLKEAQKKRAEAKEKRERSAEKKTKPAKRMRKNQSTSSESGDDECTICLKKLPPKLTNNNSIKCSGCKIVVHLKCANIRTSFYLCPMCDSDLDE